MARSIQPVKWAPTIYRSLNGVFCIYKPVGFSSKRIVEWFKRNLARELNSYPCYEHEFTEALASVFRPQSLPDTDKSKEKSLVLQQNKGQAEIDYLEHRLVLGERYITDDFVVNYLHGMSKNSSGVLLMGLGTRGRETLGVLSLSKFLRVYHVKGRLGYATQDSFHDGIFVERTSYKHIDKAKMDRVCSSAQSGHQRLMFQYAGIDPDSEEAYQLASSGIIRPQSSKTPPILYSVKCIHFDPPDFTLEVHGINESCFYLADLINEIGAKLKSSAVCMHIHRLRYGHFTLDNTLLSKHWNTEFIVQNMRQISPLLRPRKIFTGLPVKDMEHKYNYGIHNKDDPDTENLIRHALEEIPDKGT